MDRLLALLELGGQAAAGIGEARILRQLEQFEVGHRREQLADRGHRGADAEMLVDHHAALRLAGLEVRFHLDCCTMAEGVTRRETKSRHAVKRDG